MRQGKQEVFVIIQMRDYTGLESCNRNDAKQSVSEYVLKVERKNFLVNVICGPEDKKGL